MNGALNKVRTKYKRRIYLRLFLLLFLLLHHQHKFKTWHVLRRRQWLLVVFFLLLLNSPSFYWARRYGQQTELPENLHFLKKLFIVTGILNINTLSNW
jgi:hypothetical protein